MCIVVKAANKGIQLLLDAVVDYMPSPIDVGAIVVVKNLEWADSTSMPAPAYVENQWIEQAGNSRKIP